MEFYGLLGEKLSHSLSEEIHREILKYIEEEGAYKLFEVEEKDLEAFANALKILKVKGSNVTIPYKEKIMKYLDHISEEAKRIGAVNTISLLNGKLYGDNSDYYGFAYMLKLHKIDLKDKTAAILGSGGASKAVLCYLLDMGIDRVYIVSRNPKKNEFTQNNVEMISYKELEGIKGDIIINSTPLGMYPKVDASPVNEDILRNFNILVDLIYNPIETKFLEMGRKLGKQTVGGLYMLIGQALKAQEIWQQRPIDKEIIKEIYDKLKNHPKINKNN